MIIERSVLDLLVLQQYAEDVHAWESWTIDLQSLNIARGGKRNGVAVTLEPGLLSATFLERESEESRLEWAPNAIIRVGMPSGTGSGVSPIFTGRVADVAKTTTFDKATGRETVRITITATDAVASHSAVMRYGARSAAPESFAQRIIRLSESALTEVETPPDDAPRKVYEL